MEATNVYHELLAAVLHAAGHTVYVINPQRIHAFRQYKGIRYKSDPQDARLICDYLKGELASEETQLHPYQPPTMEQRQLQALLSERQVISEALSRLKQNRQNHQEQLDACGRTQQVIETLQAELKELDQSIKKLIKNIDKPSFDRLMGIVGIGAITAAALWKVMSRRRFATADAIVKFVGLECVFSDSGQTTGRRRLSKQGDRMTRRLLYCAAMSASRSNAWKAVYQYYLERGFKRIQALCILARKLLRTAWAVFYKEVTFQTTQIKSALA
jgi:transposase